MKTLALLSFLLSTFAAALVAPRQVVEASTAQVIAVSVLGGEDYTIPATVTQAPQTGADIVQAADAAAPTSTLHVQILQQKHPRDPQPIYIFPFHVQLTEYCSSSTSKVKGFWQNVDNIGLFALEPGQSTSVYHSIAGYPNFQLGPFDTQTETLRFRYENTVFYQDGEQNVCKWADNETWKECGECRAALWSGPALDCGAEGGERVSTSQMKSGDREEDMKGMAC
jgi:hypothetical protein